MNVSMNIHVMLLLHRWPLLSWATSWTSRTKEGSTPTSLRTGPRMRRFVCGRCQWWSAAHSLNPLSTWPAKWPSLRANPHSRSVATRIRVAAQQTVNWPNCVFTHIEGGREVSLFAKLGLREFFYFCKEQKKKRCFQWQSEQQNECIDIYTQWALLAFYWMFLL